MTNIPKLTEEQRRENLAKAMQARRRRSTVLKQVSSGEKTVADVIAMADGGDEDVARMRVFTLIKAVPGYGFAKTQRLMKRIGISESRRIRGLGARQRAEIAAAVGGAR